MKNMRLKICMGLAGLTLALTLATPVFAGNKILNVSGQNIWDDAGTRMVENTTYASLRKLAEFLAPDAEVSWRNGMAWVEGEGLSLSVKPGNQYIALNNRVLYVPQGIFNEAGTILVPVRVLTEALGGSVNWDREKGITVKPGNGLPAKAPYTEEELYWMARIISAESRGEPLMGKLAVGTVVLNRVASSEFPNNIYDVIFDRKWGVQFEPVANGTIYHEPTPESVLAAKMVLDGARAAGDSLYFLAPSLTDNHWIMENREYVATIGAHWFYR